jgi:FkbH-like protein
MEESRLRLRVLSDFNVGNFVGLLENGEASPPVSVEDAGMRSVVPALLDETTPPVDALVVWTRPEAVLAAVARLVDFEEAAAADLLAEVDAVAEAIRRAAARARAVFVPSWLPPARRGRGMLDLRPGGLAHAVLAANLRLAERLADVRGVFVLDSARWAARAKSVFEPRLWFMAKVPFGHDVFAAAASDVKAALRGIAGQARKVVICDLDDTLWGGLIGEVGWAEVRVGGHDAIGEAYAEVQRQLAALRRRGILLAIASKNDDALVLEALDRHPEMVLRRPDFSARRIHWRDKAESVAEIAAELNVGLAAVVFLDDNPVERARVRDALPEVLVPELPHDKLLLPATIAALDCFDVPALTAEDFGRAQTMTQGRERKALLTEVGSIDAWRASLATVVRVEPLGDENLQRAAQLLNKTSQLNLSTRRMTDDELRAWGAHPEHRLLTFRVADKFGDLGLTGLLGVALGPTATIVDFVLSCRVMGRGVEELMTHVAVEVARGHGAEQVVAHYLPTARNRPCLEFWRRSGFSPDKDGEVFRWGSREDYPSPAALRVVGSWGP